MASLNDIETKVHHIIDILDARTIKTITGVLPLTFTTTEDNLRDWEIRGNDAVYEGQQGVGERTGNLFDVSKIQEGTSINGGTIERNGTAITIHTPNHSSNTPDAKPSTLNDLTNGLLEIGKSYRLYITSTDTQRQYIYLQEAQVFWNDRQLLEITQERLNSQFRLYASGTNSTTIISDMMICKASETIDHYIPYGYEIQISVNNTPQTFYIGNAPLTEGQSISKTSTGVDIATTEGENTISTTLYNKPEMSIKYK